jgi:hypothetical protein
MKRKKLLRPFLTGLILACSFSLIAQTAKDVFNNPDLPVLYLGIDFTKSKLIDDATANETDIRDRQYTGINEVVITEAKKYDVKGAFHRNSMDHDLGLVNERNEKADKDAIKSTNTSDLHRFKEADIQTLVSGFDFKDKKGVGFLFVCEGMSKSEKTMALWATLIDMNTKKVLMTQRVEGKAGMAFGFRNYWASAVKSAIEHMEKSYPDWKAKYGS